MVDWIDRKSLWRYQQLVQEASLETAQLRPFAIKTLLPKVYDSMTVRTAPDLIMRRTSKAVKLAGEDIGKGKLIVASLASALADDPQRRDYFMFGGNYHDRGKSASFSHHACPGQSVGINTILGCAMALLSNGELDPVGPLTLRLR